MLSIFIFLSRIEILRNNAKNETWNAKELGRQRYRYEVSDLKQHVGSAAFGRSGCQNTEWAVLELLPLRPQPLPYRHGDGNRVRARPTSVECQSPFQKRVCPVPCSQSTHAPPSPAPEGHGFQIMTRSHNPRERDDPTTVPPEALSPTERMNVERGWLNFQSAWMTFLCDRCCQDICQY